jgi:pimeloyl-ACP methyl ester carboxylesterase
MPIDKINGVGIFIEEFGSGDTLVLVHGSWVDHMDWPFVVPLLSSRFHVIVYDRRGHSQSERPPAQGYIREDVADLAAIIERAGAPAHVVGNSMGGAISLKLAIERPELIRTLAAHEPPLFDLLRDDPKTQHLVETFDGAATPVSEAIAGGKAEEGAHLFVDAVVGPGFWDMMPEDARRMMINNAPTFMDEMGDPEIISIDTEALSRFRGPVLLSAGSASPPYFPAIVDKLATVLPNVTRKTFEGAGHIPHVTHPQVYAEAMMEFIGTRSG